MADVRDRYGTIRRKRRALAIRTLQVTVGALAFFVVLMALGLPEVGGFIAGAFWTVWVVLALFREWMLHRCPACDAGSPLGSDGGKHCRTCGARLVD